MASEGAGNASDQAGRAIMERFWSAVEGGDFDGMGASVADDIEMVWPHSGERFKGRSNALAALKVQPEKPEPAGEPRLVGCIDLWTIKRTTEYFGAPFPPNEARAPYAELA